MQAYYFVLHVFFAESGYVLENLQILKTPPSALVKKNKKVFKLHVCEPL